jgi:hypothetical protein
MPPFSWRAEAKSLEIDGGATVIALTGALVLERGECFHIHSRMPKLKAIVCKRM